MEKGQELPFDLEDAVIYYVGPTPEQPGKVIGSAGPPQGDEWTPMHLP